MNITESETPLPEPPEPTEPAEQHSDSLQALYAYYRRLVLSTNNPTLKRVFSRGFLEIASPAGKDGSMGGPQDGNITE